MPVKAGTSPFEPSASLARVAATPSGYRIDCRGPHGARRYDFVNAGEAAEFAVALRDDGGWRLRFGTGAEPVRAIVDDLSEGEEV